LPQNAQPVEFIRDFGATAALMLTVASPKASETQIALRARAIADTIRRVRSTAQNGQRAAIVFNGPASGGQGILRRIVDLYLAAATRDGTFQDGRVLWGPGFVGVDGITSLSDTALLAYTQGFTERILHSSEFHPDAWPGAVIRDPAKAELVLSE